MKFSVLMGRESEISVMLRLYVPMVLCDMGIGVLLVACASFCI